MKTALTRLLVLTVALIPSLAVAQNRIVIDPGHGGSDPGGVGSGLLEKNIVLDVGRRFKTLLDRDTADTRGGGRWVALLTRSSDVFVSLSARAAFSNNQDADRFMSIHSNAFANASANGTETFAFAEGGTGAALRNLVQAEMIAAWRLTNRGNKVANFAVLRDTAAPAVLHELGFITNATDAAHLASATERQKAAVAHLRAIQRHFGITPFLPALAALSGPADGAGDPATGAIDPTTDGAEPTAPGEAAPPADSAGDDLDDAADTDAASAGCSTASGTAGAFTAFALLGLAAVGRRRRR
jgi:MYXO-CTERM domain-containing protein